MSVDCKKVEGRRKLSFTSLDEVVADAEKLVSSPDTKMLGNWPLGRLLTHLANSIDRSIDGSTVKPPWIVRLIGPLMKGRILRNGMSAGSTCPSRLRPFCTRSSIHRGKALKSTGRPWAGCIMREVTRVIPSSARLPPRRTISFAPCRASSQLCGTLLKPGLLSCIVL